MSKWIYVKRIFVNIKKLLRRHDNFQGNIHLSSKINTFYSVNAYEHSSRVRSMLGTQDA